MESIFRAQAFIKHFWAKIGPLLVQKTGLHAKELGGVEGLSDQTYYTTLGSHQKKLD